MYVVWTQPPPSPHLSNGGWMSTRNRSPAVISFSSNDSTAVTHTTVLRWSSCGPVLWFHHVVPSCGSRVSRILQKHNSHPSDNTVEIKLLSLCSLSGAGGLRLNPMSDCLSNAPAASSQDHRAICNNKQSAMSQMLSVKWSTSSPSPWSPPLPPNHPPTFLKMVGPSVLVC